MTDHVCSFDAPPLDEVVFGIQFQTPSEFNSTDFREVWELFRREYPGVVEQPRLNPQFESFGGSASGPSLHFDFVQAMGRNRLWFVSSDDSHLVQFQDDRMFLNWRNRPSVPYPRHPAMVSRFAELCEKLAAHFSDRFSTSLRIGQAEVAYFNIIPLKDFSEIKNWVRFFGVDSPSLEGLSMTFSEVIDNDRGRPFGRMYCELQSVFSQDGLNRALRLSLTCRGKPETESLESAISFITFARNQIVTRFCELTTREAQAAWGRTA